MALYPNEMACILSHRKAWETFLKSDADWAIFCEDDVHFSPAAAKVVACLRVPANELCVLRLETFRSSVVLSRESETICDRSIRTMHSNQGGAAAYLLNRLTAEALVAAMPDMRHAVDVEMFDPERRSMRNLEVRQLDPAICIQDGILNRFSPRLVSNILERSDVDSGLFKEPRRDAVAMTAEAVLSVGRALKNHIQSLNYRKDGKMRRVIPFA